MGPVSRKIERYLTYAPVDRFTTSLRLAIDRARSNAENRERAKVAEWVRSAIATRGLTAAQFAECIETSASRLSTHATGSVTPSAHTLLRIEAFGMPFTSQRLLTR